ncbi:uncharacterized protein EAE97_001172 [Botrytis byssoidea]|uniref:Uncharacterized protein n=1 Tax=Botrytis byssoidea TaxID=139641 RepID=A0A9P5IXR3_9HELO|nr:uncharacterized protein EAE97_001172 [Botrytis byssoidea]KAF7953773.1 hypothetical protein EAE97_001172 [Botrytis byssoidea]
MATWSILQKNETQQLPQYKQKISQITRIQSIRHLHSTQTCDKERLHTMAGSSSMKPSGPEARDNNTVIRLAE